jgi:cellulose synthase operon protein C
MEESMGVGVCKHLVSGLFAAYLLAACSAQPSEADLLKSAKASMAQRKFAAANIELKNLLQQNQSSAEARFLLGKVLLETGQVAAADVELRKARELGYPEPALLPVMARVLLAKGQRQRLIDEYMSVKLDDPQASAELNTTLAIAYGSMGDKDKAAALLATVLRTKPDYIPAILLQVRAMADTMGADAALQQMRTNAALLDKSAEAAHLSGNFKLNGKNDVAGAIEEFRRALALDPTYVPAHMSLVAVHLYKKDLKSANDQVAALKKALPKSVVAHLYEAQMAYLAGENTRARQLAQQLLRVVPDDPRALYIAGAAELNLNSPQQAAVHLNKLLSIAPAMTDARMLLVKSHLRAAQPTQALKVLVPALETESPPYEALTLAAEAHLQIGDAERSEAYFRRALKIKPTDPAVRTALASAEIAKGNVVAGIKELERVAEQDQGAMAEMALINSRLQRGEIDLALQSIAALEKKQADRALPAFLRGRVLILREDLSGARKSFEQALSKDPAFFPAVNSLALLDLMQGKPEDARQRLEALLKQEPGNTEALMSVADLRVIQGAKKDEVVQLLGLAVKSSPGETPPHRMLVEYLILIGDGKAALEAANAAMAAVPESLELMEVLGRAQAFAGQPMQAIATFGKLIQLQPKVATTHVSLAEVQVQLKNPDAALRSLKSALAIAPDFLKAQQMMIALEQRAGRPKNAVQVAREIQAQRPDQAIGHLLEGNIESQQKRWPQAIAAYRAGLGKDSPSNLPAQLHFVLMAANQSAEAAELAQRWLKEHPKDLMMPLYLGDLALAQGNWALAEQHYRLAYERDAGNALAANNIAWLMVKQKKAGAVPLAEKAVALAPTSASARDTLAEAQAAEGQLAKAIETARQATLLAPDRPQFALNLARLQIKAGEAANARKTLQTLASLGDRFDRQSEVAELLKGL